VTSHALKSFWRCYDKLPAHIQKLADKQFALFKANPGIHCPQIPTSIPL